MSGRSDFEAISDINLPWARLISTSKCWNNVNIIDDKWTFGKKASEEALNEKFIPPRVLKGISNFHFSIERTFNEEGNVVVLLIDLSKSGTWIGDNRVVQNVSNLISNDDYIGITGPATKNSFQLKLFEYETNEQEKHEKESIMPKNSRQSRSKTKQKSEKMRSKSYQFTSRFENPRFLSNKRANKMRSKSVRSKSQKRGRNDDQVSQNKKSRKEDIKL